MSIAELVAQASDEAVAIAEAVLRDDIANRARAEQVGPCLSQRGVAKLLGKTDQAVAQDRRLFRVRNADGRPVYPAFQFDGRSVVPGIGEVSALLLTVDDDLTTLAWLTAPKQALDRRTPVALLRDGNTGDVLAAARRWVARSA